MPSTKKGLIFSIYKYIYLLSKSCF
jgi:hypothetical protein